MEGRNRFNGMLIRPVTSDATAIDNVTIDKSAAPTIYSLSGQRLSAPQKGVNVIDGKKVVVK